MKYTFLFVILGDEEFDELCFDFGLELDEVVRALGIDLYVRSPLIVCVRIIKCRVSGMTLALTDHLLRLNPVREVGC